MSRSRHFTRSSSALKLKKETTPSKIEIKKEKNVDKTGTFQAELEKFDKEIEDNNRHRSINKTKRKIKHIKLETENGINANNDSQERENDKLKLPANFFPMYNKIKEMRELIITPVDLVGCIKIPLVLKYITDQYSKNNGDIKHIEIEDIAELLPKLNKFQNELNFQTDKYWRYQLLVTLLFSSQTKDEVNFQVMQSLHTHYLSQGYPNGLCMRAVIDTDIKEIDKMIFKIGFHSRKAQYLKETTQYLYDNYNEDIPDTIEELVQLKGIGYKMGHLILQGAWNKTIGISVDTHMVRLCNMFHWLPTKKEEKNPDNVRKYLEGMLVDHKELWNEINPVLVGFGQSICTPTGRRCDLCLLSSINDKNDVVCPAVDKKLLLRIKRGVEKNDDRKIRGDLEKLINYKNGNSI